ncbi:MAG: thioredoxin-disulfide reductase [Proteobacteria bacterium SG_bin7]|nr:MAG: thioredoxin-disulfide reductase [Proteobacteria bacterium SG_bin7]
MSAQLNEIEKVIIIGSGPAGLTAALYASRAMLKPLMIEGEEAGGQLMLTSDVENYPGFANGITGPEMMEIFRKQAERFGTRFLTRNVTKVDFSSRPFKVWVGDKLYQSKAVIVATGASAKYIGLPSEKSFMGRGVSACATCDGAFFKNVPVAVIGGGDTAMEEATFMTRFASRVFLLHRRDVFRASKIMIEKVRKNPKIEVRTNVVVDEVTGGDTVSNLKIRDTVTNKISDLEVKGMFVAIGHQPNTSIFKNILEMNEVGYLKIRPGTTYTSIEGVFAAGDVADPTYRQAITAAGTGCMAAIDCERWLEHHGD